MAKLTRIQTKAHEKALEILKQETLTHEDKEFVFDNWHEGANHNQSLTGSFFTPLDLAFDAMLEVGGYNCELNVLDMCAGIGALSYAAIMRNQYNNCKVNVTCLELNPDYIEVGKKLVPEANWVQLNIDDVLEWHGDKPKFDYVISNPPFGKIPSRRNSPKYKGADFEYQVISLASELAEYGVFIVPQMSAGFNYSGKRSYERQPSDSKAGKFQQETGLFLECGIGVNTAIYRDQWRGASPLCEVVSIDFSERIVYI